MPKRPIYGLSPEDLAENETRSEGVYCRWEPPLSVVSHERVLIIERVNGDCSVETFSCQESEAAVILEFLCEMWEADSITAFPAATDAS